MKPSERLVWMDLEMTGLDPRRCTILEIGAVITDNELRVIDECAPIAIRHSAKTLSSMEPWSRRHHRRSGLTEECRRSKTPMRRAEEAVLELVRRHCPPRTAPLCGNSIGQDRRFLVKYMPRLEAYLHYRNVDVSSVKELVNRWYPASYRPRRVKNQTHRVADDIRESIEELRHYRSRVFVKARAGAR